MRFVTFMAFGLTLAIISTSASSNVGAANSGAYQSVPKLVSNYIDNPRIKGQARLTVFFFKVYDAVLYSPEGQFDYSNGFALELNYLRDFSGEDIARRSVDEMRDIGFRDVEQLATWQVAMEQIFPDVKEGDQIIGVKHPDNRALFYYNGTLVGEVDDPIFSEAFFGIWLHPDTSQPAMRRKLLGAS